ncbi:MAG: C40 family peptidase [Oscillatoriaceae bacterium SKW80]|nr:C40 family peptidase [Oscillatoriaceae bacterium SKYG93]MCX8119640.1 C40 family peptidase [Oscillatoriaceae bacterium SKW80]MDW8455107.1 C40 family peptidase [Oscillatoriaceae cyanobacterium SKYGB_i_bin93]HIK28119.1 C40 family peptidase [Oscillatoriaceae cyanobacterium M7585_C2015_266]
MVSLSQLQATLNSAKASNTEYQCLASLNLYDSPNCTRLATQAVVNRQLRILEIPNSLTAVKVQLVEDDYIGWLAITDLQHLEVAQTRYQAIALTQAEIKARLPAVIAFTLAAMQQPNQYLWGGTVAPNYDCSGFMQAAFLSAGIWLPRDAYQQEAFTKPVALASLEPGDLIFFGLPDKATHVALYLGDGRYIHSSGKDQGRNGIGIDVLSEQGDIISQNYYRQLRGAGRVVASYQPSGNCQV